jgi:hypothetical protein
MFADEHDLFRPKLGGHRAEQAEFTVANNGDARFRSDRDLLADSVRSSERLGEDCFNIGYRSRYGDQIRRRQTQEFRMCSIAAVDTEDGACRAMSRITRHASIAFAATGVDLTDNPLPNHLRMRVACLNDSDELMTDRSVESGIAAHDLEIRVADSRQLDSHKALAFRFGSRNIFHGDAIVVYPECLHTR